MGAVLYQLTFCLSDVLPVWLSCPSWPATSFSPFCAASMASSQPSVESAPLSFLRGRARLRLNRHICGSSVMLMQVLHEEVQGMQGPPKDVLLAGLRLGSICNAPDGEKLLSRLAVNGCLHTRSHGAYVRSRISMASGNVPLLPFVLPEANCKPLGLDPLEKPISVKNACAYTDAGTGTEVKLAFAVRVLDIRSCRAQGFSNGNGIIDGHHLLQRAAACSEARRRLQYNRMQLDNATYIHCAAASDRRSFEAIRD